MAKQVNDPMPENRGGNFKYPWKDWLNGEVWLLECGKDFQIPLESMRHLVHATARRKGFTATCRSRPEGLYVKGHPPLKHKGRPI